MSGRLYDNENVSFYICTECKSKDETLNSAECNFNGPYCKKCETRSFEKLIPNDAWNNYEFTQEEKIQIDLTKFEGKPLNFFNNIFVRFDRGYNMAVLEAKRNILKYKNI